MELLPWDPHAPLLPGPQKQDDSSGSNCLTCSSPVDNLCHCCFAIRSGRSLVRLCRGLEAGIKEAIGEVGVFLQVSMASARQ